MSIVLWLCNWCRKIDHPCTRCEKKNERIRKKNKEEEEELWGYSEGDYSEEEIMELESNYVDDDVPF